MGRSPDYWYDRAKSLEKARYVKAQKAEAFAKAKAEHERELAEHEHGWKNWEYDDSYLTETRTCRVCGATETRKIRM